MPRVNKTCPHCKAIFPCHAWHKKKFCSAECRAVGRARGWKSPKPIGFRNGGSFKPGQKAWNAGRGKLVKCPCGKDAWKENNQIKDNKGKFCSKSCAYKWRALKAAFRAGPAHPAWIDGSARTGYPPQFNPRLKKKIKTRDGSKCQLCGMTEAESKRKIGRALCVNHIDFNKQNCDESNLNTLCIGCNVRINWDREKWTRHFTGGAALTAA